MANDRREAATGSGTVKSADRVLSIFEYFERARKPSTLGEIAHDLDFPTSSTLALLRSMQEAGYLVFDGAKKQYFPSFRLVTLGSWLTASVFHNGNLMRMMEHLAEETGEAVFLGVQNGMQAQYVHVIQARNTLRYHPPVGTSRPLLRSSIGRALMSQMPDRECRALIARISSRGADEGRKFDVEEVMADLRKVSAEGYAYNENQITSGAGIVAVALPVVADRPNMALGVGGPALRINPLQLQIRDRIQAAIRDFLA